MRQNITLAILTAILLLGSAMISQGQLQKTELRPSLPYRVVDTGQTKCYDNRSEFAPPQPGPPLYGQDAHFQGVAIVSLFNRTFSWVDTQRDIRKIRKIH